MGCFSSLNLLNPLYHAPTITRTGALLGTEFLSCIIVITKFIKFYARRSSVPLSLGLRPIWQLTSFFTPCFQLDYWHPHWFPPKPDELKELSIRVCWYWPQYWLPYAGDLESSRDVYFKHVVSVARMVFLITPSHINSTRYGLNPVLWGIESPRSRPPHVPIFVYKRWPHQDRYGTDSFLKESHSRPVVETLRHSKLCVSKTCFLGPSLKRKTKCDLPDKRSMPRRSYFYITIFQDAHNG